MSAGYAHSPLNGPVAHDIGGSAPGERVPPVAGQLAVGAEDTPRFALFAGPGDMVSALPLGFPRLLEPVVRPPIGDKGVWLVRLDVYTACVADREDVGTMCAHARDAPTPRMPHAHDTVAKSSGPPI